MEKQSVEIPQIQIKIANIELIGLSPLIMHKFSEKAKRQIEDKQQKKAKQGKEARDPNQEAENAIHYDEDHDYCFPSNAFKGAAVRAATDAGLKMTDMRRAFHINGETVKIIADAPILRTDRVVIGMGTTDIRYRPQFNNWRCTLQVSYNSSVISLEQICNLLNIAGFGVGIGEMRPEKKGGFNFGMFQVR